MMHCKYSKINLKINQYKEDRDGCGYGTIILKPGQTWIRMKPLNELQKTDIKEILYTSGMSTI